MWANCKLLQNIKTISPLIFFQVDEVRCHLSMKGDTVIRSGQSLVQRKGALNLFLIMVDKIRIFKVFK